MRVVAQELRQPFVIDPSIGDTLTAAKRAELVLLPNIVDFEKAVFYLNPDSSLRMRVFMLHDGVRRDSVIARYHDVAWMRNRIAAFAKPESDELPQVIVPPKGETVIVTLNDETCYKGELLSVRDSAIVLEGYVMLDNGIFSDNSIKVLPNRLIDKITLPGVQVHSFGTTVLGFFGGMVIGAALLGWADYSAAKNRPVPERMGGGQQDMWMLGVLWGGIFGAPIGALVGYALSLGPESYSPDHSGLQVLKQYARYPDGEPDYLKKIL